MDNLFILLTINLTLIISWAIINKARKNKIHLNSLIYRQSQIYEMVKDFIPNVIFEQPKNRISQARRYTESNMIRVVMVEGDAYWITNNTLFVSKAINGDPDPETAKPVDTSNMSREEIEKMLFIVDNLKGGISDDSSGTGH